MGCETNLGAGTSSPGVCFEIVALFPLFPGQNEMAKFSATYTSKMFKDRQAQSAQLLNKLVQLKNRSLQA